MEDRNVVSAGPETVQDRLSLLKSASKAVTVTATATVTPTVSGFTIPNGGNPADVLTYSNGTAVWASVPTVSLIGPAAGEFYVDWTTVNGVKKFVPRGLTLVTGSDWVQVQDFTVSWKIPNVYGQGWVFNTNRYQTTATPKFYTTGISVNLQTDVLTTYFFQTSGHYSLSNTSGTDRFRFILFPTVVLPDPQTRLSGTFS